MAIAMGPAAGTITEASTVTGSAEALKPARYGIYTWIVKSLTTAESIPGPKIPEGITITEVSGYVIGGTSASFNIQARTYPHVASTFLLTSDLSATTTGASTTSITNPTVVSGRYLYLTPRSLSGDPTYLSVTIKYEANPAAKGRVSATSSVTGSASVTAKGVVGAASQSFGMWGDFVRTRMVKVSVAVVSGSGANAAATIVQEVAGAIAAGSSVVGTVGYDLGIHATDINGVSSVAATACRLRPVSGSVAATSSVLANIGVPVGPSGSIAATSSVIGYADQANRMRGQIASTSSAVASATIMYEHRAAGAVAGAGSAVAKFTYTLGCFRGISAGASSVTGLAKVNSPARCWVKINGEWRIVI
jgi:hypothetical protein